MDCKVYGEVSKLEKTNVRSVVVTISSEDPKQDIQVIIPFTDLPEGFTVGKHAVVHLALAAR